MKPIVFIDSEINIDDGKIMDLGAVKPNHDQIHTALVREFVAFAGDCEYLCGHNIVAHDMKYLERYFPQERKYTFIDTLPLSPLLFPRKPYHKLLKDDKLQTEEVNNPLNDAIKAMKLFGDEMNAFHALPTKIKWIYCALLYQFPEFQGFFDYNGFKPYPVNETATKAEFADKIYQNAAIDHIIKSYHRGLAYVLDLIGYDFKQYPVNEAAIKAEFADKICQNATIDPIIKSFPRELAYALALIGSGDRHSVTPPWVLKNYPKVDSVVQLLCGTPCQEGCPYCESRLNVRAELKRIFGYDSFRTYNGEPLQERAADAAVHGKSLLAVFPTGGGKSITFQLPALMAGEAVHGLTVVISPLQSLMKDQVDNLENKGLVDAVTVNGLLSPIERAEALKRVRSGMASLLYISPEQLRSKTIEKLLLSRNIVRFVIDEAHCFSAWGQDFRVDYLYIGDFLRELQKKKRMKNPIPVSCFTATAKQKVITDIKEYFKRKLDLDLELFATSAARENLHYAVLCKETEEEKYNALRALIEQKNCPTIVYVSRTRRTKELAAKLTSDGFPALPFNGKMDSNDKIANQEAFIRNEVKVIVATSAFGMGVDKKDVKLVIHYDISDSLENYVQEAGRAGRDQSLQAECYVLFNDNDLDKHFILLNQTKLSISEIQQVWKAVKDLTRTRPAVCCSELEIARQAGWDYSASAEMETRVRTAIAALENAGYLKRGKNMPHVYATSILAKNMAEAGGVIDASLLFTEQQKMDAKRIIKSLISSRSIATAGNDDAESRVDYLADTLGIDKENVIQAINLMRQEGLLQDSMDMSAFIRRSDSQNKTAQILERFIKLERFLLAYVSEEGFDFNLKELNEKALASGVASSSVKNIRTLIYYWTIKNYIQKRECEEDGKYEIVPAIPLKNLREKFECKIDLCQFLVEELYRLASNTEQSEEEVPVEFSLLALWKSYNERPQLGMFAKNVEQSDIEDALLYLSKIGAINLEGGFLVIYNGMEIKRIIVDNKIRYKVDDYRVLSEFYKQKIQQIHIVGEYANLMVKDYNAALQYVQDYFQMDFKQFIAKYFKGERAKEINRNITPDKYNQLFGNLSDIQTKIISDDESRCIVVAAGPGSGKTRVLVHKLASLLLLEDVKHEQLLMVTFSRAAATEFKKRLMTLIGNAANFVEIKTFHSYCFDLLGKIGSLEGVEDVVKNAAQMIENGEVEIGRITKTVVVIDEAQDMDANEFALIEALMSRNDDMRVIAVGDDDQNIYEFRGSDSKYLRSFITDHSANVYEMTENYRSASNIVSLANAFAGTISNRMKCAEGQAMDSEDGIVQIIHHNCPNLEYPIVRQLIQNRHGEKSAILTATNDEALRVLGLLNKNGIRAKLIQSNDGFQLYNLAEIRFFLKMIDSKQSTSKIADDVWTYAKKQLCERYADSPCLEICKNLIADFESVNRDKYRTDLEEIIKESKYEDFYGDDQQTVTVSTIHKAKGREFDSVYLLLNNVILKDDETKRKVYVALTRAKKELYIHCNNNAFARFNLDSVKYLHDDTLYPEPAEIVLQLTHRDVVLDFFKSKKKLILSLRSGMPLHMDGEYMTAEVNDRTVRILKLSKACIAQLSELETKGYHPTHAEIRFIVAWKGEEDTEESAIVLPNIVLSNCKAR